MAKRIKASEEVFAAFCERIAGGRSVRSISKDKDMPSDSTFYQWLDEYPALAEQYARACAARARSYGDRIGDVVDQALSGEIKPEVARVAVDAYKWISARLQPVMYGDRQEVNVSVAHTHTLHLEALRRLTDRAAGGPIIDAEPCELGITEAKNDQKTEK